MRFIKHSLMRRYQPTNIRLFFVAAAMLGLVVGLLPQKVVYAAPSCVDEGACRFQTVISGWREYCVQPYNGGTADNTKVVQGYCNWEDNRDGWLIDEVASAPGWYKVKNMNSSKCLDVYNNSTGNGAAVVTWGSGCLNSNQHFRFHAISGYPGQYWIVPRHSSCCGFDKVLDVKQASTYLNADIVQYQRSVPSAVEQRFRLLDVW